jgi:hypothetical protein
MELFLNLVWCAIAAAAAMRFFVWSRFSERVHSPFRRRAIAVATVCIVALLFPIISVTDDLASDSAIVEETSYVRRSVAFHALHILPQHHSRVSQWIVFVSATIRLFSAPSRLRTAAREASARPTSHGFALGITPRGPPLG